MSYLVRLMSCSSDSDDIADMNPFFNINLSLSLTFWNNFILKPMVTFEVSFSIQFHVPK